jgi:hypothetical protein
MLAALVALCAFVNLARAEDAKEVSLTGSMACAKCVLKDADATACQSVLQVKDGDNTVRYYLADNQVAKDAHAKVCHHAVDKVTVTGTVEEKDGKKWITASKVEFPETKS